MNCVEKFAALLFQNKCGLKGNQNELFKWCSEMKVDSSIVTTCKDMCSAGESTVKATFYQNADPQPYYSDITVNMTITCEQENKTTDCTTAMMSHQDEDISRYCESRLPLSALSIVLLVLLTIGGLALIGTVAFLFWKRFIAQKTSDPGREAIVDPNISSPPSRGHDFPTNPANHNSSAPKATQNSPAARSNQVVASDKLPTE